MGTKSRVTPEKKMDVDEEDEPEIVYATVSSYQDYSQTQQPQDLSTVLDAAEADDDAKQSLYSYSTPHVGRKVRKAVSTVRKHLPHKPPIQQQTEYEVCSFFIVYAFAQIVCSGIL